MSTRIVIKNRPSKSNVSCRNNDIPPVSQNTIKPRSTLSQVRPLTDLPSPSSGTRLSHIQSNFLMPIQTPDLSRPSNPKNLRTLSRESKGFRISRRNTNNVQSPRSPVTSASIRNSYQMPVSQKLNFEEDKKNNLNLARTGSKKNCNIEKLDSLLSLPDLPAMTHCSSSRLPNISIFPPETSPSDLKPNKDISKSPAVYIENNSDSDSEDTRVYDSEVAKKILADFLKIALEIEVVDCAEKAEKEVISAYLSLSSSKICYNIINEVLEDLTPKIVQLAYYEENVAAFTGVRNEILAEIEKEEISSIVSEFCLVQIALEIMKDYAKLLPIQEIASECAQEEACFEYSLSESIYFGLISCLADEDWFELLIEDEISKMKIEDIWNMMPGKIVKELKNTKGLKIAERLAEEIWFDFLNEDLGGVWVEMVVKDALNETNCFQESEVQYKGKRKISGNCIN